MRLRNGTGPPHWRHGQRAQRAGEFYESNVYELIVNCSTGCFFTSAAGVRSNEGKPLVSNNLANNVVPKISHLSYVTLKIKSNQQTIGMCFSVSLQTI